MIVLFDPDDTATTLDGEPVAPWFLAPGGDVLCTHHACLYDLERGGMFCEPLDEHEVEALEEADLLVCAHCADPIPLTAALAFGAAA